MILNLVSLRWIARPGRSAIIIALIAINAGYAESDVPSTPVPKKSEDNIGFDTKLRLPAEDNGSDAPDTRHAIDGGWDLKISIGGPSCVAPGEAIGSQVDLAVLNSGAFALGRTIKIGVYLSLDANIETADTQLKEGSVRLNDLPVGFCTVSMPETLSIPDSLTFGAYYLGAIVDVGNELREPDETNNADGMPIQIAADAEECSAPKPQTSGQAFDKRYAVPCTQP